MPMNQDPTTPSPAGLSRDGEVLRCTGAWTVEQIAGLEGRLRTAAREQATGLDASSLELLDTTGALLLLRLSQRLGLEPQGLKPGHRQLLDLVRERCAAQGERSAAERPLGPVRLVSVW